MTFMSAFATMDRCLHTNRCIHLTLAQIHHWYSPLEGLSIVAFLEKIGQPWRQRIFNNVLVDINHPLKKKAEEYDCETLFRMIKYLDHFAPESDPAWHEQKLDSFESWVSFIHEELEELKEATALSECSLNRKLDQIQNTLLKMINRIEEEKNILLKDLRNEVIRKFDLLPRVRLSHLQLFSVQHSVHRMFVTVFKQLNCLDGKSVEEYCIEVFKVKKPLTAFTLREQHILKSGVNPEMMPVRLLFKLIERVCDLEKRNNLAWTDKSDKLEYLLCNIKELHTKIVCGMPNTTDNWPLELHINFEKVLNLVSERTKKPKRIILSEMPEEPLDLNLSMSGTRDDDSFNIVSHEDIQANYKGSPSTPTVEEPSGTPTSLPSQHGLTNEEINIACIFQALCPGGPAAKVLIVAYDALNGDIQTKLPILKKKQLNSNEKKLLTARKPLEEMDITLLYKLIQYGCDSVAPPENPVWQDSLSDSLEYHLYALKQERNKMAHEKSKLTKLEVKQNLHRIRDVLRNILQHLHIKNIDIHKTDMETEIKRLQFTGTYMENVAELRDQLCHHIQKKALEELCSKYKKNNHASPVTWHFHPSHQRLTIEKVFTEPEILNCSATGFDRKNQTVNVPIQSLYNDSLCNSKKIIMQGGAGCGKTSVCQFLANIWAAEVNKSSYEKNPHLLFLIRCKAMKHDNLKDFLHTSLPNTFSQVDRNDIIPLMQDLQCIFIFDAYDEASKESKQLMQDIFDILPGCGMLITTKPHLVSCLQMEVHQNNEFDCLMLELNGFNKDKRKEFIDRCFAAVMLEEQKMISPSKECPHTEMLCSQMLSYLDSLDERHQKFVSLPLTLSLLVILWLNDTKNAKQAKTLTSIYSQINKYMLKRFKLQGSDEQKWMQTLQEAAWHNLKRNSLYISTRFERKLLEIGNCLGLKDQALSAFLHQTYDDTLLDDGTWEFTHNSQQEFLAAEYLANKIIDDGIFLSNFLKDKLIESSPNNCAFLQVLEFVIGLLAIADELDKSHIDDILGLVSTQTPWAFEVLRRIDGNIGSHSVLFQEKISNIFKGVELLGKLEYFDPEDLHWIIKCTAITIPDKIQLYNCVSDVARMRYLLKILEERSCAPQILTAVDNLTDAQNIVQFLKEEPGLCCVLYIRSYTVLPKLIGLWTFTSPLYVTFPETLFPLFWWELKLALITTGNENVKLIISEQTSDLLNLKHGDELIKVGISSHEIFNAFEIVLSRC